MDVLVSERSSKFSELERLKEEIQRKLIEGESTDWEEFRVRQIKAKICEVDEIIEERGLGQWI